MRSEDQTGRLPTVLINGLAVIAGTLAAPVALDADGDWYVRGSVGFVLQDDDGANYTDEGGTQGADASFDPNFTGGGAIGRWLSDRGRVEIDFSYRSNDNDEIRLDDGRVADDGNYASTALSLNGYYHFRDASAVGALSPYAGAGIAWLNEIDIDLEGGDFAGDAVIEDLEDDGVGFQIMGGVSWKQTDRLRWDAEVRWLFFGDADLEDGNGTRLADIDYSPLGAYVGLSYGF